MRLIDLPGIYSLTSYSMEEMVSRKVILGGEVDVIVNVVDASALERNLYLTLQLLELGKPVILALNMMDIVEERGMELDLHRLPEMLGNIPVVPVSARKRSGLDVLLHAVKHHYEEQVADPVVTYKPNIEMKIQEVSRRIAVEHPDSENIRWHSIKILENDEQIFKDHPIDVSDLLDRDYEKQIINQKYEYIETVLEECVFYKGNRESLTEKADRVLTHPLWGVPVFLGIMAMVFFLTFTVGDIVKGLFESWMDLAFTVARSTLVNLGTADWLVSLIVDGIMTGVGGILTFLPNIFILFLALAFLEDSGYMARVAYVMDGIMGKVGLSGKAFLPMVLGFGCTVPAVMASRTLENQEDRKKTILLTPFMSCSARLPIYVLFADMFFGKHAMMAAFSLYALGLLMAIAIALVIGKLWKSSEKATLLIELPDYKGAKCQDHQDLCVGKGKGLPDESRYYDLCGLHCHLVYFKLWYPWHDRGCDAELRRPDRQSAGAPFSACRTGNMADRGGPDLRSVGQGSGNIQLLRALWSQQCKLRTGHGCAQCIPGVCGIRSPERLFSDGILPAVYTVCGNTGDH